MFRTWTNPDNASQTETITDKGWNICIPLFLWWRWYICTSLCS